MINVAPLPARLSDTDKDDHRSVELDNVITVKLPMRSPSLSRETVVILSHINREMVRKSFGSFGITSMRKSRA
jgi:hypothetical protein